MRRHHLRRDVYSADYEHWLGADVAGALERAGFRRDLTRSVPASIPWERGTPELWLPVRTHGEIAKELGVTPERVRQIEQSAIMKLRKRYTPDLEPRFSSRCASK